MSEAIAERLDDQFAEPIGERRGGPGALSEKGCRFLAEIVARFYLRQP